MKVSVLIHNLNRGSILKVCLDSVCKQLYRPVEVIMLDAGSTDSSDEVIKNAQVKMVARGFEFKTIKCPKMGVAASRNYAAERASGDLLCIIDNDACFVSEDSLGMTVQYFLTNPYLGVISYRILKGDGDELDPFSWVFRRPHDAWVNTYFRTFTFVGCGCCVRRKAFQEVGGFWGHLKYSREEEDMGLGLIDKGWEIGYAPDIRIRHYSDPRGRASIKERRYMELKNGLLIFWRRFPWPLAFMVSCGRILTMTFKALCKEKEMPWSLLKAVLNAVKEWKDCKEARSQVSIRSSIKYFALHFMK